jgi:hypothetical protein
MGARPDPIASGGLEGGAERAPAAAGSHQPQEYRLAVPDVDPESVDFRNDPIEPGGAIERVAAGVDPVGEGGADVAQQLQAFEGDDGTVGRHGGSLPSRGQPCATLLNGK